MISLSNVISAQETKVIEIQKAGSAIKDDRKFPGATILDRSKTHRVHLSHQGALVISDQAIFYAKENNFKAHGNVVFTQGDSIRMTSEKLDYNGDVRHAIASGSVHLTMPEMDLKTEELQFDRIQNKVIYETRGIIIDSTNTLTSNQGVYFMNEKKYRFLSEVDIENPEYSITSERLDYYPELAHAFLYGPTEIIGETYEIRSERGFYDMALETGVFKQKAVINYDNKIVYGDSLYFDNQREYAAATGNIKLIDTINRSIIQGHYGEIFQAKDSAVITHRALAINIFDSDSLYIHADTLVVTGPENKRIFRGFYDVRLFKQDIQGKSDSLYIDESAGITKLLKRPTTKKELQVMTSEDFTKRNPVLWFDKTQMTGNEIHLISNIQTNKLDSLKITNNVLLIEKDTLSLNGYNQISGAKLDGFFEEGKLKSLDIKKNTMMIYYVYNDQSYELIGIDKSTCSAMRIEFESGQINEIIFHDSSDGIVYPETDLDPNERVLEGFFSREHEQPKSVSDLFSKEDNLITIPLIETIKIPSESEKEP